MRMSWNHEIKNSDSRVASNTQYTLIINLGIAFLLHSHSSHRIRWNVIYKLQTSSTNGAVRAGFGWNLRVLSITRSHIWSWKCTLYTRSLAMPSAWPCKVQKKAVRSHRAELMLHSSKRILFGWQSKLSKLEKLSGRGKGIMVLVGQNSRSLMTLKTACLGSQVLKDFKGLCGL